MLGLVALLIGYFAFGYGYQSELDKKWTLPLSIGCFFLLGGMAALWALFAVFAPSPSSAEEAGALQLGTSLLEVSTYSILMFTWEYTIGLMVRSLKEGSATSLLRIGTLILLMGLFPSLQILVYLATTGSLLEIDPPWLKVVWFALLAVGAVCLVVAVLMIRRRKALGRA